MFDTTGKEYRRNENQGGPERKPVLLQVLPALASGGVERGTVDIARAAARAGFISLVASSGGPMAHQVARAGGEHITLPLDSKNPWRIWRNAAALEKLIRARGVDIIQARSRAPAWSAYFAAQRAGCHFITTFHGIYKKDFPFKDRYNAIMARGEKVIAISGFVAEHLRQEYSVPEERIRIIPRGVDLAYFDPAAVREERVRALIERWRLSESWPVIFLPGRFTRWKGQGLLLDALARLKDREFYCVMAGKSSGHGSYYEELAEKVRRYGLGDRVRMTEAVDDMPAAYMLANLVISASLEPEAFGRVAAEAQAMGRPVIATDLGGSRETVLHGETGWLVQAGAPEALAEAMADTIGDALALDAWARASMGAKGRKHVARHFSLAQMTEKTLEVYREALAGGGR